MAYIKEIDFSILSPDLIRSMARVRIVSSELYDTDGYPVEGGVMDPRLGVIDPGLHCRTCNGGIGECPGHFGYLELAKPVIQVLYTKFIYYLLKLTCIKCNRIMIKDDVIGKRLLIQPQKCPHCKTDQKKISFVKPYAYYEDKTELTPTMIRERFEKISNGDLKRIGVGGGRPEWLILTLFPIPPVTMRPSITLESGERSEDDLTHKLVDVVRINQSLKENIDIGAPDFILNDLSELVQYHISTYFDNELTGAPLARHRSGRALKGLIQRLKAKEGRIRGNLLGKRVNFSARTVISPDPRLSINEVGVPEVIAEELTLPEYVTHVNQSYIKNLIRDGKVNYVERTDNRRMKITPHNKDDLIKMIEPGWLVERQIRDGDIALFNRQPSLHRISMMAHKIKIMPYKTFRLNPSVCPPYNADFDGDEMNLHIPQNEEARAEATFLMQVQNNINSPRFGGPVIGLDLDQITGMYLLTKEGTVISKEDASQLLASAGIEIRLPDKDKFTGKEIFSLLLSKDLEIEFRASCCKHCDHCLKEGCKYDAWVKIKNGILEKGAIDAAAVGAMKGKVLAKLNKFYSPDEIKDFIDNAGRLAVAYLMTRGLSIGISDLDVTKETYKEIKEKIKKTEEEADDLIEKYKRGELKVMPGMTPKQSLEIQILNKLSNGVSEAGDIISKNIKKGDIIHMAVSGAKGSFINTTQMAAVVGQETILGKRIKRGYFGRTLPHFKKGDIRTKSKGFVASGFKDGLNAFELFWNIMNGREGLMDKSLRTRKSGYMQRRLVNALQDLKVEPDMTVKDSSGRIVQFVAGEDGIDPSKSDWGKLDWREEVR
ncbi:MAG: DNA-directed RNA polymerase subunit A' [Nanoarchaeota archaeon]|nr:DNA-directed RNA polymerase subunit A' [Nanoarchaeota archaeon]MBU1135789.1 DNA-directed RNA polymerase subunit A' [Nanoarchaeota archaeon]MBU2519647.1 DNA-directed RNA polymerase subunit A' [Nanoarchaeota archaeon]